MSVLKYPHEGILYCTSLAVPLIQAAYIPQTDTGKLNIISALYYALVGWEQKSETSYKIAANLEDAILEGHLVVFSLPFDIYNFIQYKWCNLTVHR